MVTIPEPSVEQVSTGYEGWENLGYYPEQECFLKELFTDTYPENVDRDEVLIKVSSLDSLYSTNIGMHVYPMALAEHIVGLKIDQYTKSITGSDSTLVNEIAKVKDEEGKDINLFSFATKYCSFHFQKEDYPIYDKHVLKMLMYCKKNYGLKEFTGPRTKTDPIDQHPNFYDVMEDFQKRYGLEKYTLRQIEKYLWYSVKYKYKKILPKN